MGKTVKHFEKHNFITGQDWCNRLFTRPEVEAVIKRAKDKKSVGGDYLPYEVFKNTISHNLLFELFNVIFKTNLVPTVWLKSLIKPIPKGGDSDPREPLQYRGISLLSTVGKLYSSLINKRVSKYLEEKRVALR